MVGDTSIIVTFYNPIEESEVDLQWKLNANFGALLWLKLFKECLGSDLEFMSRFSGFIGPLKTMDDLGASINESIEVINASSLDYHIEDRYRGQFNQEFSNIVHHHFEILMGQVGDKSNYYLKADHKTCLAIINLNACVHDMEALQRNQENLPEYRHHVVVAAFYWEKGIKIPSICDKEFTLNYQWGDMVLNYAQIGKTWLEVFIDDDEEIFEEAILPLENISGGFDIFFGQIHEHERLNKGIPEKIKEFGHDPSLGKHRIGFLPIAHLDFEGRSAEEITEIVAHCNRISHLKVMEKGVVTAQRRFHE